MNERTVEEQIAAFRPTLQVASRLHLWLLAGAAVGVTAAVVFRNQIPLLVAIFLAIVGVAERRAGPNIVSALAAYDTGVPSVGEVCISITRWDTDNHYHATVREDGHVAWRYEFIPQGWHPTPGPYPARIWRTGVEGLPVLAIVDEGILIPRYKPSPVDKP
jgi:hypothetical protein